MFGHKDAQYLGEGFSKCVTLTSLNLNLWGNSIGENEKRIIK